MVHKRRLRENENKLIVAEAVAVVVLIHKEVYESIPGHVSLVSDQ